MLPVFEHRVRPFPPAEVLRRSNAEVDPQEVGVSIAQRDQTWSAVERLYKTRLHPAVTLCVRKKGQVIINRSLGHVRGNGPTDSPGTPKVIASPETLFTVFSTSKAITAMVIHLLDERGLLRMDDAVAEYIPEFACHGKDWVTIRHVLTHRAGIPTIPEEEVDLDRLLDWDYIVGRICEAKPLLPPGRRLAYHAITGGYVLGEVVRRLTGKSIRDFLQHEILDPLGFNHMNYGVPEKDLGRVAENVFTGPPLIPPLSWVLKRALGVSFEEAVTISNDKRYMMGIVPSGNVIGTANEVCKFFELLRCGGELDGVRIFDPRTVRRAVSEQSYLEVDLTLAAPVRYGLGFILGAPIFSLYGPHTASSFGHLGFTNIFAWADPKREISACLMTSGKPFISPRLWRLYDVMRHIGRCGSSAD